MTFLLLGGALLLVIAGCLLMGLAMDILTNAFGGFAFACCLFVVFSAFACFGGAIYVAVSAFSNGTTECHMTQR